MRWAPTRVCQAVHLVEVGARLIGAREVRHSRAQVRVGNRLIRPSAGGGFVEFLEDVQRLALRWQAGHAHAISRHQFAQAHRRLGPPIYLYISILYPVVYIDTFEKKVYIDTSKH